MRLIEEMHLQLMKLPDKELSILMKLIGRPMKIIELVQRLQEL
jgi:hypothetical protein